MNTNKPTQIHILSKKGPTIASLTDNVEDSLAVSIAHAAGGVAGIVANVNHGDVVDRELIPGERAAVVP